jgi:hypothetical protein
MKRTKKPGKPTAKRVTRAGKLRWDKVEAEARKRMGRPTKPAVEGTRVSLGLRVTAEVKNKLEEAAIKSGRSISQEAELRIERSFEDDRLAAVAERLKNFQLSVSRWMEQFSPEEARKIPQGRLSDEEIRQIKEKKGMRYRLSTDDKS